MERGDCCKSPAPRSRAGQPRIQRLLEIPRVVGADPGRDCTRAASRGPGGRPCAAAPFPDPRPVLLVRLHRSWSREPSGTGHLRPQPGGESREPGELPLRGLGLQVANFSNSVGRGVGREWGPRGAGKLELGDRGCGWGEKGVPGLPRRPLPPRPGRPRRSAFPPPARSGSGCTGPSPGRGPHVWATAAMGTRARAWRRGRLNERLGESREEALILARRWRLRECPRVNRVEGECGRRGAWERMACARVKSRARDIPAPPLPAGPRPGFFPFPLPCQGPAESKLCPARPQTQRPGCRAFPPGPVERGAAAGTGTRTVIS